jgi:hypothetical protein
MAAMLATFPVIASSSTVHTAHRFDLMYLKAIDDYRFDDNSRIHQRSYKIMVWFFAK